MFKVILLIETSSSYGRALLRGIANYSRLNGPWTFYRKPPFYMNPKDTKKQIKQLKDSDADGIIMRSGLETEKILSIGLPAIVSSTPKEPIPNIPNIVSNHKEIGQMAAKYFLDRGFTNFAYCGFQNMPWSKSRCQSFSAQIAKESKKILIYNPKKTKNPWQQQQNLMADWLKSLPKPIAIMACSDDCGQQIIEAAKIANIKIPDEVAILGVDNDDMICDLTNPPLSSIEMDIEKAGYRSAQMLEKMMTGKKIKDKFVYVNPIRVITRRSTDILAIKDVDLAEAVKFIQKNSSRALNIFDVTEKISISRRSLERKFRQTLGRSILDEIKQSRIEKIIHMLIETDLPISQIAMALKFSSSQNMSRFFQHEIKITPLSYRKKYSNR